MARVVVLFGPPAIGKSSSLKIEKVKYKGSQFVMVDKDVLNSTFFEPKLKKLESNSPTDILKLTVNRLVELAAGEMKDRLTNHSGSNKPLVVILQAVKLSGVKHCIEVLLRAGFEMEFILLAAQDPEILLHRINERASKPGFIGADPMPLEVLDRIAKSCNQTFSQLYSAVSTPPSIIASVSKESAIANPTDNLEIFRQFREKIKFRVKLLRTRTALSGVFDAPGLDVVTTYYDQSDIQLKDGCIVLGSEEAGLYELSIA
ncbi:hypothetical protein [Paenibacillus sp. 2TAB19]|uniref:hypothetical protein n=1 Tax=Paenibacillus sp. 2TAB19 TaxID=3233003 RepID=UPI003F9C47CD